MDYVAQAVHSSQPRARTAPMSAPRSGGGSYGKPALPDLESNFVMSTALSAQCEHCFQARVESWSAAAPRRQRSGRPKYPLLPFCKYRIVDSPADVERER
jgi:hypothetical protein